MLWYLLNTKKQVKTKVQGWKLALAYLPMTGKFHVGPVDIFSGLVKCPTNSIQIIGYMGVIWAGRQKRYSFHTCMCV